MNSFKVWFVAILATITVFTSFILFNRGISIGSRRDAIAQLHNATKELKDENTKLYDDNEKLSKKTEEVRAEYNKILENDSEFAKYNEKVNSLTISIDKIKQELANLGTNDDLSSKYAGEISKVSNAIKGDSVTLKNSTLNCPKDISEGRYKIEGQGSFRIIKLSNNNVIESQNLKNLESNSYTCRIEDNCKLIVDGVLKFTEVD